MIIRSLSIQSHDKLGTPVFKLMIIFVCCIQTQLIIFMPHAGLGVMSVISKRTNIRNTLFLLYSLCTLCSVCRWDRSSGIVGVVTLLCVLCAHPVRCPTLRVYRVCTIRQGHRVKPTRTSQSSKNPQPPTFNLL